MTLNDAYKESAIIFLIQYGGVLDMDRECSRWEKPYSGYYHSGWGYSHAESMKALESIREHGIDFNASSEPSSETSSHFNGTFTDTQLKVDPLRCDIVSGGNTFPFAVDFNEEDQDFSAVLKRLLVFRADLDVALDGLEERLTKPKADSYFSYDCRA